MSTFFWSEQKPSQAFSNLKKRFNAKGIFLKKRCPACQGYPAEARQLAHFVVFSPPPLPPPPSTCLRRVRDPNVSGWFKFEKK